MNGSAETLFWLSKGEKTLEIPFFQRPYVWDEENWLSLVDSIKNSNEGTMPFIGSFILQSKGDGIYSVIDGQQRITTLTLLIKALLDSYKTLNEQVRAGFKSMIYKTIFADIDNVINTPRLTPAYLDKNDYDYLMGDLIDENKLNEMTSKISECYKYFINYIKSLNSEQVKNFTKKLYSVGNYVIIITLDLNDDEQEIFDTVNSLGKRLTNSDIVKNYLYQQMRNSVKGNQYLEDEVLKHYKKYWDKVFYEGERRDFWDERISLGRISTTNLDSFLKDFGTIKGIYTPSESGGFDGLAKQYKAYINTLSFEDIQAFSIELSDYADEYYKMKSNYKECNDFRITDRLNTTLLVLDKLELSTFNPYILQLVKKNEADKDDKLFSLQRFVLQRFCWKASIKNYNKICLILLSSENPCAYLDSYNSKSLDAQWDLFPSGLKTIKDKQATLVLFIIEMIRRNKNGEDKYSDTLLYNKTLEHIMPQKWERNWSNVPSYILNAKNEYEAVSDYEEFSKNRKSKIYSIGNMTLLASKLNSTISNESFKYKVEGKKNKGIKPFVGTLSIAQEIVDAYNENGKWDERDIMDRESSLFNELNDYYDFVEDIKTDFPVIDENAISKDAFTDEFFNNKKVDELFKISMNYLLSNQLLSENDILELSDEDFSLKTLSCAYPCLITDSSKIRDSKGRVRYYKDYVEFKGKKYYLCKEWFEHNRKYMKTYFKGKLGLDINA